MDEDERQTRQELMILEALVQAMDRRDEVFQVIEDSEDVDEAIRRVGQLLGVGALGSRAVLDLQSRRFTRDQRQAIASRAEECQRRSKSEPFRGLGV
ncbi:DNA gyrase subunit A [Arthrobacter oryzae]|uniref:DNA gyrase subunit A n=1 Tax=Arthrobacter oryzae TaxID=409290 RepID=UPI00277F9022|nr:DNA gyrase subunit A [Arthrobacter oryzae]MDQ0076317.1 DNA gyrase/topoisomerase IV subunit A [Arthrobacter oryzae]